MMANNMRKILFFARRENFGRHIDVSMAIENGDVLSVAQPVALAEQDPNLYAPPMLRLSPHEAQSLMDELWNCGLRPTEGSGSAGSLAATEKHLKDMRKIAGKYMEIEL